MQLNVGDVLRMKKAHPCGGDTFKVLRIGADFKLECMQCAHVVMLPRNKVEKGLRAIETRGEETAR